MLLAGSTLLTGSTFLAGPALHRSATRGGQLMLSSTTTSARNSNGNESAHVGHAKPERSRPVQNTVYRSVCRLSAAGVDHVARLPRRPHPIGAVIHNRAGAQSARLALRNEPMGLGFGAAYRADRKSTRLNSSHVAISYAVFCLKKKIQ